MPNASRHDSGVNEEDQTRTPFHDNLIRLIGGGSVNAWAKKHKLDQSSIQRLIDGQDPRMSTIQKIADALEVEAWQLLVPGFTLSQRSGPEANAQTEAQALADQMNRVIAELQDLRQSVGLGSTPPAPVRRRATR